MAAAGAVRRALRDLPLQFRIEEVVPVFDDDAEALQKLRLIDESVGLEHRPDPELLGVLQRQSDGLADLGGDLVPHLVRHLDLVQQVLLGKVVEERPLSAPEDVRLGFSLPLHDLAVGDGRALGHGACLHVDAPLLLRIAGKGLQHRIMDVLGNGRDQVQLVLNGLGEAGAAEAEQGQYA